MWLLLSGPEAGHPVLPLLCDILFVNRCEGPALKLELTAWPGAGEPGAWGSCRTPLQSLLFLYLLLACFFFLSSSHPLLPPALSSVPPCLCPSLLSFLILLPPPPLSLLSHLPLLLPLTPPPSPAPPTGASAKQRLGAWAGQAHCIARATLWTCLAQGQEVIEVGGARAADWEPPAPAASFRQTSRWQVSMGTKSHLRSEAAPLSLTGTSLR